MPAAHTVRELNALDRAGFVDALASVFEGPPWIVEQAWDARPFASVEALHQALCAVMYATPVERQIALLRAHPDLVGRAALAGTLGPASTAEQAAAGLDHLTPDEITTFQRYNAAYREKFGFPFVICARENKKASILAGFAARLEHTREEEIATGLGEVAKICALRLGDLVAPDEDASCGQVHARRCPGTIGEEEAVMGASDRYTISYGKFSVPVYRVYASPLEGVRPIPESAFVGRENTLFAAEVDVEVFGDNFLPAYTQGDNSNVVATDSMKNFILRHALDFDGATLEAFAHTLGSGLLATYDSMEALRITARELPFVASSVPQGGSFGASEVLFQRTHGDYAVATLDFARMAGGVAVTAHRCAQVDLQLLKVTGSSFTRFVRDDYTTLPERSDRPLYIYLNVHWTYSDVADLLAGDHARYVAHEQVRDVVATVFHELVSESIQHLVHEIGTRLLQSFPQLASVSFEAQNRTRDPVAVSETDDKVRVYSDPFPAYGLIKLTMARGE